MPLTRNCDCTDRPGEWRKALAAADREAAILLVSNGVLAEGDSFDRALHQVADDGFSYAKLDERLGRALVKAHVGDEIDGLQIEAEEAKCLGTYALGLAAGIRLAGGAR